MKQVIITLFIVLGLTSWNFAQNGLDFDGNNDVIQTNYSGVLGSANRTFEAWIFISFTAPTSNMAIIDYGANSAGSRNTFAVSGSQQLIFISGGTNANISTSANTVPVGSWVHVAFVLDNGTGYLYVNGVQMATGSLSSVNTPSNMQNVKIGERVSGASIPFHGKIDDVRIWDVARTATEIQNNIYDELCGQYPNLKLYLKLNEGIAGGNNTGLTSTIDDSGNGHTATLNNFSLSGTTSNWASGSYINRAGSSGFLQQSACGSFFLTLDSMLYTQSGLYVVTKPDASIHGCDSILTLILTIGNANSAIDTQMVCSNSYTWIDGNTYTSNNNTATDTLTNVSGCDSIITLNLTIDSANASVIQNGTLLTTSQSGATYQWVKCPEMTPISGATNQSYTVTTSGDYAVIVSNNHCSDTSECFNIIMVGTIENEFSNSLQVFPNPTNGQFSIDMGETYNKTVVTIMDLTGKLILSETYNNRQLLNIALDEPSGIYLLMMEAENKKAIIRLVKD